jgi:hypothetical protein
MEMASSPAPSIFDVDEGFGHCRRVFDLGDGIGLALVDAQEATRTPGMRANAR